MAKEQLTNGPLDRLANALSDPNTYERQVSRRGALIYTTQFSMRFATALSLTESVLSVVSSYYDLLLGSPDFETKHTYTKTFYSSESLQKTHCIVIGDSIAKGIIDGQPTFAGTQWVTDLINTNFHSNWQYHNLAVHGSRISAVDKQLLGVENILKQVPSGESIDIVLSVGGNDVGQSIANEAKKEDTKSLLHGDITLGIIPLAHSTLEEINTYKEKLVPLLQKIVQLKKKGHNIQRIFLEGLPNMGNTDTLTLLDEKGDVVTTLDLTNNSHMRKIARNISSLVNDAMSRAIDSCDGDIDILLIDNFHNIPKGQLKGLHPTKQGQYTIGKEHLNRSLATFNGQSRSFAQQIKL